jgi:crotonobetainyl-CoA:carnitine CoA-transferase CaiB-like acyl-CoA transferase
MLGLQNEREWPAFCRVVLEQPALAQDPRFASNAARSAAREVLRGIIETCFASLDTAQVTARLEAARIANARVNTMADVWAHPQLQSRGRWTDVDSPAGRLPARVPPGMDAGDGVRMDAVPALGQHTDAILRELGWADADISDLRAQHVV